MEAAPTIEPSASSSSPISWAIFLASSWTWCIGMFLPVLLVRDYGLAGWIVFAIPNVIGAAAMGWTVRDRAHSAAQERAHADAMAAFSIVTVAFQVFFGTWYFSRFFAGKGNAEFFPTLLLPVIVFSFAAPIIADRKGEGLDRVLAAAVYVISLICAALFIYQDGAAVQTQADTPQQGLAALAAVCVFGFALCPYLDLTFHKARQNTSVGGGRASFGLGFGVLFLVMIVFSLIYARDPVRGFAIALAVHIVLQLGFTCGVHLGAVWSRGRTIFFALVAICVLAHGLGHFAAVTSRGELFYRLFMSFYGLIFPAYVWLCMLPNWNNPQPPTRRMWIVLAGAVILAAPAYFAAFIGGKMIWAVPGLAMVLLARLTISTRRAGELGA